MTPSRSPSGAKYRWPRRPNAEPAEHKKVDGTHSPLPPKKQSSYSRQPLCHSAIGAIASILLLSQRYTGRYTKPWSTPDSIPGGMCRDPQAFRRIPPENMGRIPGSPREQPQPGPHVEDYQVAVWNAFLNNICGTSDSSPDSSKPHLLRPSG